MCQLKQQDPEKNWFSFPLNLFHAHTLLTYHGENPQTYGEEHETEKERRKNKTC